MSFLTVVAQALLSLGKNQRDRDQLVLELSNRHAHQNLEGKSQQQGFYAGMKPGIRRRVQPVIEATAEAYKKKHPKEFVPDFNTMEGAANAQELSEEVASANRRFFNRQELYGNSGENRG